MPRGRSMRNPNGYGSIIKLSGNRRKPFEVRVNTIIDDRGYPIYDVLGRYVNRKEAALALAEYNQNPYDLAADKITFAELYKKWYEKKYELSRRIIPGIAPSR